MRYYTEQTQDYLNALTITLCKDPASLENWRCMHYHPHDGKIEGIGELRQNISKMLKSEYTDLDGDVIFCEDQDVMVISRNMDRSQFYDIAETLNRAYAMNRIGGKRQFTVYDVFREWKEIRQVLLSKVNESAVHNALYPEPVALVPDIETFSDIRRMRDVFEAAKRRRPARQPAHILLVEDDPLTRRLVSNVFKESFALMTAENASEAISNYLLHAPDIVFLDINLPDHDGFKVLDQILAIDQDAYVVMFSGNSYLDNVTKSLMHGARGFVAKPFRQEKMRHYITDCAVERRKYM